MSHFLDYNMAKFHDMDKIDASILREKNDGLAAIKAKNIQIIKLEWHKKRWS